MWNRQTKVIEYHDKAHKILPNIVNLYYPRDLTSLSLRSFSLFSPTTEHVWCAVSKWKLTWNTQYTLLNVEQFFRILMLFIYCFIELQQTPIYSRNSSRHFKTLNLTTTDRLKITTKSFLLRYSILRFSCRIFVPSVLLLYTRSFCMSYDE